MSHVPETVGNTRTPGKPGSGEGVRIQAATPVPSPLTAEALQHARSGDPDDHATLAANLLDRSWLDLLDASELTRVAASKQLQLGLVLDATATDAPAIIDRLTADPMYAEPGHRQIALINASARVEEPGESLQRYWRSQLNPEADELEATVAALVRNQSRSALDLLAETLASDAFEDGLVSWWFHGPILERRQDAPLLVMCDQLLKSGRLSAPRQAVLFESLFDYRPDHWYIATEEPSKPPSREKLTEPARVILRTIAERAHMAGLIDEQELDRIVKDLGSATP